MADQTVSLTLTADAESLKAALRESGELMDELGGKSEEVADGASGGLSGLSAAWEENEAAIRGVAGGAAVAGAAMEGFARSQGDTNRTLGRTAQMIGESEETLRDSAVAMSDWTFQASDAIAGMERLGQAGVTSLEDMERVLPVFDDFADATGIDFVAGIDSAQRLLNPFGQSVLDVGDNVDQMTRIINQTDIPLSTLERNLGRIPDELQELEFGLDEAAAGIEIFRDRGFSGQEAVREFRRAVAGSEGDFGVLIESLGVTSEEWDAYVEAVTPAAGLTSDTAQMMNDTATPLERLQGALGNFATRFGGFAETAGQVGSTLTGAGGLVFGMSALSDKVGPAAEGMGRLAQNATGAETGLRGVGRAIGIAAVAWAAGEALEYVNEQLLDLALGAPVTSDELALAADGIVAFGEAPESVSGAFDDLGGALDTVNALGHDFTQTLDGIPVLGTALSLVDPSFRGEIEMLERADEVTRQFGDALATAVREGNTERLAVLMSELGDATGLSGDALEEFAREQWPEYAQAIDRVALDTADASDEVEALGDAFDDTGDQTLTAAEAIDEYLDAVRRATDPVFRLIDAIDKVDQAQENYNETMADAEASLEDQQAAAIEVMRALEDLERAAIDGDLSFEEFERQLDRWVAQGGLTEQMAAQIRDRVAEARGEAETFQGTYTVTINATGNAWENMRALVNMRAELSGGDRSRTDYGRTRRARGGPVWPGEEFLVGEEGPELVTFGKSGFVHDAQTTAQMMAGPSTTTTSSVAVTQNFNVQPDAVALFRARDEARTLAEVMA